MRIFLPAFAVTEFSEIFLGRTAAIICEGFFFDDSGTDSVPHLQGVAGGLVEPKLMTTSSTLKMGTYSVPETSKKNLHILSRLSARENVIDYIFLISF
jgi:hypothetical protein